MTSGIRLQDSQSLISAEAELDRDGATGVHLIDDRRILDRVEEAL